MYITTASMVSSIARTRVILFIGFLHGGFALWVVQ